MSTFGQKLIEKAKAGLKPQSKYIFDTSALEYVIKDGKETKKSIKSGKVKLNENGMEFTDNSKPKANFAIKEYDSLHLVNCQKDKKRFLVTVHGRKMKAGSRDDNKIQDPMEALKLSKSNRSNLSKKNLLILCVKNIDLGKAHGVQKGEEIAVSVE